MKPQFTLAVMSAVFGLALLALLVFGPSYGTVSMTLTTDGQRTVQVGATNMVEIGISDRAASVLAGIAVAFMLVPLGAWIEVTGRRWGRWLMLGATVSVAIVSVISFVLVTLLPAVLLAAVATIIAFTRHPDDELRKGDLRN